jgi:hypothetical protein
MLRQILKLKQAQRAFADGRFADAATLAGDPDIREHLKAQKLKKKALDALRRAAERHEKDGELSQAAADWRKLSELDAGVEPSHREAELQKRQAARDEGQARLRDLYFRARLKAERGDLAGAVDTIECVEAGRRTDDMRALLSELAERLSGAARLVRQARAAMSDPAQAELLLERAAVLDPACPGLLGARLEVLQRQARAAARDDLSDAALVAHVVEHGMKKRRALVHAPALELEGVDAILSRELRTRVAAHLGRGELAACRPLVDRARESLARDPELERIGVALRALAAAGECARRGEIDDARGHLATAGTVLEGNPAFAREAAQLAEIFERTPRMFESAQAALRRGDLSGAKQCLLDVIELTPRHREAQETLAAVNKKIGEQEQRLAEARALMQRGRFEQARAVLFDLRADQCTLGELSALLKEVKIREKTGAGAARERIDSSPVERAETRAARATHERGGRQEAAESAAGGRAIGHAWMLTVEEHGEYCVLESDAVVIGNAVKRVADLAVLAPIASRHALLRRAVSFHGGVSYAISAIDGQPLSVNDKPTAAAALADGDVVRLGREFSFVFRMPSARSRAALLQLAPGFQVEGTQVVILAPPSGRAGAIVVGDRADAHVRTPAAHGECEIYRDRSIDPAGLVLQGPEGVARRGAEPRAQVVCRDGDAAVAGDLRLDVANAPLR